MADPIPLLLVKNEPVADIVTYLEGLLARAKEGDVQAIALGLRNADGSFDTWWGSGWGGVDFTLVTAISRLAFRYQREAFEESEVVSDGA